MPIVKIYTTPTCAFCHAEKEFFKEHNIEFQDLDVFSDAQAREYMINRTGQMGVPVTEIDGKLVIGFEKGKLKELLGIK